MNQPQNNTKGREGKREQPSSLSRPSDVRDEQEKRSNLLCYFWAVSWSARCSVPLLLLLTFVAAMMWAKARDPFRRMEFSLKTAGGGRASGIAVLPKPAGKYPVVVYLQGAGGSLLGSGNELRQVAELGLAAVGFEYDQTNQSRFDEQFVALHQYLQKQSWAQNNATAWVGFSLGAQRTLSFALRHPEIQPQLLVRRAGGWVGELDERESQIKPPASSLSRADGEKVSLRTGEAMRTSCPVHCPVLLVHGERDDVFPVADCKRLAERLRASGTPVEVRVFPEFGHVCGPDSGPVVRALAEYCAAHLPLADYTAGLGRSTLGPEEVQRFNLAMRRAGQHRRDLWRAVKGLKEPERHTVMTVIGGLEDYDLAHISAAQLQEDVKSAWRARRKYPWCRDTPLEIFERFVANRRIYEEPLPAWQPPFLGRSLPRVKYARDTAEASDAVGGWLYTRMRFRTKAHGPESSLPEMLEEQGSCREGAMMYTYLGRLVGLPMRPAYTIWPTLASWHWFSEVWSTEERQWHAVDSANEDRTYRSSWVLRVPKSAVLSTTGDRGGWNALDERRWEAFTNTIGLFYPSGRVVVRVVDGERPVKDQRVIAEIWLREQVLSVAAARTDANGEAQLTLGQSAVQPYRLSIDKPGEPDWQWLAVQCGRTYAVTLDLERSKPFDKTISPPPLGFPNWERSPAP